MVFRKRTLFAAVLMVLSLLILSVPSRSHEPYGLFRKVVSNYSKINTIDTDIVQHITAGGRGDEKFSGRYRVDQRGRFRIDYQYPEKQVVVFNGKRLLWYYPQSKILYVSADAGAVSKPELNPVKKYARLKGRDYRVIDNGRHLAGFFTMVQRYVIRDSGRGLEIELWIDRSKHSVVKKVVKNAAGYEIIKDIYSGFKMIDGIYVPGCIDVYARTEKGITRSTTYYRNIKINRKLPGNIFTIDIPSDVRVYKLNDK